MNYKLPPLPDHPEPRVMAWSELEKRAIREYGEACAIAAIAAIEAQGVPDGWQLVPKEPTLEMIRQLNVSGYMVHKYRAMLASAPPAPQEVEKKPFTPDWVNYRQGFQDGQASVVQQQTHGITNG